MRYSRFLIVFPALLALSMGFSSVASGEDPAPPLLKDLRGVWRAWFNHDATVVVVRLREGGTGLWDAATGRMIPCECSRPDRPKLPEQGRVIVMRADHRAFAMSISERETRVFDATTGKPLSPILKASFSERHPPRAMFSPDGTSLLIMDAADHTQVFSVPGGELRRTLMPPSPGPKEPAGYCVQAVFPADGKSCFLISAGGVARRYNSKSWKPIGPLMEHPHWRGSTFGLTTSEDGRWIATTDSPGENGPRSYLQLWDGRTGKKHGPSLEAQNGWGAQFAGGLLFATPGRGEGRVIYPATGQQMFSIPQHNDVEGPSISLSPDGHSMLSFGYDRVLILHDAKTGERKGNASQPRPGNVLWAPDSSCLYVLVNNSPRRVEGQRNFAIVKLAVPELEVSGEIRLTDYTNWMELSLDGRKLLVCQGNTDHEALLIVDTDSMTPAKPIK